MDLFEDGQELDPEWVGIGNNVSGILRGCRDASVVARTFALAGWTSRSSSWQGYELETSWCRVEVEPVEGPDVLLNGVVDLQRVDELADVLHRSAARYSLELYDGDNTLVREIQP
ncbi:hypothetical protein [Streptomyces sp. NPDC005476]|uniref:hypothetical protein n=1 Tax=Streptomyces sp. NPDC005476 TaxID=3156882 RepID=UPI00345152A7